MGISWQMATAYAVRTALIAWLGTTLIAFVVLLVGGLRARARARHARARGVILLLRRTGERVHDQLEVELMVRVEPRDRLPFLAAARMRISALQLPHLQPGKLVTARYRAADDPEIEVETLGYIETDRDALQLMLRADIAQASRLNSVGVEAPAIVTGFTASGVFERSDNQAATLDLAVFPKDRPKFNAQARGVFGASFLHRFQPGNTITIRYDPGRPHLVAIDRAWAHRRESRLAIAKRDALAEHGGHVDQAG
jgi:hypothetical protein